MKKTVKKTVTKKSTGTKAAATKTSAVKAVAKKVVAKESPAKKAEIKAKASKITRVVAHIDVGWGHALYIRGEGAGLSWQQGVPMICEKNNEWHWVAETDISPIVFKVLVDDKIWAQGENVTINAGDVHLSEPKF
ncbi:MAG: hypothetical protein K6B46_04570 [Opitutales bacterium]|nr:hypothetical protein [Opitutales bacterium]